MERKCVVCHDKPARFRCIQCHKPVCEDCSFKTEHGAFCGRECAVMYRDFKKSFANAPRRSSGIVGKLLVLILIVVAAAAVAYKMGWLSQLPLLSGKAEAPAQVEPAP